MNLFETLLTNFPNLEYNINSEKIIVKDELINLLTHLKNTNNFDILLSLYAVDFKEYIELNYYLYSTINKTYLKLATKINNETISIISIYPSAYYDECEIYDLFGIKFSGNNKLKRLLMPSDWKGHPLKKDYITKEVTQ